MSIWRWSVPMVWLLGTSFLITKAGAPIFSGLPVGARSPSRIIAGLSTEPEAVRVVLAPASERSDSRPSRPFSRPPILTDALPFDYFLTWADAPIGGAWSPGLVLAELRWDEPRDPFARSRVAFGDGDMSGRRVGERALTQTGSGDAGAAPPPAVPEAQTWWMLITGFAMIGATVRHRRLGPIGAP